MDEQYCNYNVDAANSGSCVVISQFQNKQDKDKFGLRLMLSVAYSASIGGMSTLIGTPPNAIVFASGYVTIPKMARAGLPLDIIGIVLVTILTTLLVPLVWSWHIHNV